ncbi:hypothetical protein KAU39_03145 [bacterium]|nr:hypothetical protein [bacterium]
MKLKKGLGNILKTVCFLTLAAFLGRGLIGFVYAENKQTNQVRIDWSEFKKLLKIDADEIKLSWDEFKRLIAQTGSEIKVEYNIQNGMVVLQREQFKKLLQQMKPPDTKPLQPPGDYLITKAEYFGVMGKKSTTFKVRFFLEIFKKERKAYPKIRLLSQEVALKEIKLNAQPALVMNEGGWYVLTTPKSGQHIVDMEFSIKSALDKGPDVLNLAIPQTAITLFNLSIPLKEVKVEIPQAKQLTISRVANQTKVKAILSTSNYVNVKLHRTIVVEKKKGPAKLYAETMNLFSLEDDALRVNTRFKLNILQNTINNVKVYVPQGYSVLYVKNQNWQEIRDWNTKKVKEEEILTVPFESEKEGTVIFNVVSEKIFSSEQSELEFNGFEVLEAIRETGYIGAEKKSTAEAEIIKVDNIDRVDIQELPYDLINMSAKPLIFGFRYLRHPFILSLKVIKHEELPTVNTVIDNASVMSVLLEEGKVITRVVYTMRNTWKQFLQLKLPKDSEIWSLYVNGKRELPSKTKEGKFMIPLIRSKIEGENIASFDVEILYYNKNKKFRIAGSRGLQFPTADVVVTKMLWSCYFPVDYRFLHFGGDVEKEKIASGIRPLMGNKRVFTYRSVNGYNEALENWRGQGRQQRSSGKLKKTQQLLQSEFRTNSDNNGFLNQLDQEINFAQNIKKEQQQGVIARGGGGVALLKIEMPTSGQIYRFAKTLVEGEELHLSFQYVKGWIGTIFKILFLFLIGYLLYFMRAVIRNRYIRIKNWFALNKNFWDKLKTPQGVRVLLCAGAVVFGFVSRFLFIVFVLLFLVAWLKPEWIFKREV